MIWTINGTKREQWKEMGMMGYGKSHNGTIKTQHCQPDRFQVKQDSQE